jgi:hypothetical protein
MSDAVQEYVELLIERGWQVAESKVRAFVERTGLPVSEVLVVQFPNGKTFPQWRHAVRKVAFDDPDWLCPVCGYYPCEHNGEVLPHVLPLP